MKRIAVLGGGFYGCHIAKTLQDIGHYVELHEIKSDIFLGASGNIPARLHMGFHYPRSMATRVACVEHANEFLERYGFLTGTVLTNIYAIAAEDSQVDYEQYLHSMSATLGFLEIYNPKDYGIYNVEGAILTTERNIITDNARTYFRSELNGSIHLESSPGKYELQNFDYVIDCTFAANNSAYVDRYEPCLVLLLEGDTSQAVTIMDGPFASLYPWNQKQHLCSLSSAKWSPFSKSCETWAEADDLISKLTVKEICYQADGMVDSMAVYYPTVRDYPIIGYRKSIRAMPKSGADTRLVKVFREGRTIFVRAGKIDAIFKAEHEILEILENKDG